jgi:hypothetical protein
MRFESYKAGEIRCFAVRAIREHFEMRSLPLAALHGILILILLEKCPEADCSAGLSNTSSEFYSLSSLKTKIRVNFL